MKKRTKIFLAISLLLITIVLSSCKGRVPQGETPLETEAALRQMLTGTQGVELTILPNYPPSLIYDENELIALVEVHNKGNYDLEAQDCFLQITGFDPNIIGGTFGVSRSCAENYGVLEGKNLYNSEGSTNQLEFRSSNIILPDDVFEHNPTLNFVACYNYLTRTSPEVCVDPLFYQVTSEQKNCIPMDISTGGGQGAPVGISYVGVDMTGSKAIFEINVRNYGGGRVLSPYSDITTCGQASLDHTDVDKVLYNVDLSGGSLINCNPQDGLVRLDRSGNGKIICSFSIPGTFAFKTPLQIELDYNYIKSAQRQVKIIATPK